MQNNAIVIEVVADEQKAEAQSVALALPSDARAVKVIDNATREDANTFFLRCRDARKKIAAVFDPHIERAKETKRKADEVRAGLVAEKDAAEAPIKEAERIVNAEILRFDTEERIRREKEQREAEAKARKEAEEAALRAAAEAEAAGDKEEAAAILEEAVTAPPPIFVPAAPPPPKLAGSAEYTVWRAEVTDLKAVVLAVASGKAPLTYLQADEVAIRRTVTAQKGSFACPGVKTWPDVSRRPTGR